MTLGAQLTRGGWAVGNDGWGLGGDEGEAAGVGDETVDTVAVAAGDGATGDELEATGTLRVQAAIRTSATRAMNLIARVTVVPTVR
jgi:hypothetical protein